MKQFFNSLKKSCRDFFTNKSGFSLVELIVVIAIMAVMAAVLAPALLGYVERSRAQKDDSATDEIVAAIHVALADQLVYDEVLEHSVWDNVSCYIDKKDESQFADCKVQLKAEHGDKKEQYMFGDEARLLDETVYYAAGNMRGLTITFSPSESGDTYDFANGILNKFVGRKTGILSENPELYNRLRSVIGDKLDTTSQTYRNSDYTIFIRVGSTGGGEAVMQDAIQVWGQFNGTNLTERDHKYELSSGRVVGAAGSKDENTNNRNNEDEQFDFKEKDARLNPDDGSTPQDGDVYQYEDYTYTYKSSLSGWHAIANDKTKTSYGAFLESINGKPIKSIRTAFKNCQQLTVAPEIPDTVVDIGYAFYDCDLMTFPIIPENVITMDYAFCTNTQAKNAPIIPKNVKNIRDAFMHCYSLSGTLIINAAPSNIGSGCLGLTKITEIVGDCPDDIKEALMASK